MDEHTLDHQNRHGHPDGVDHTPAQLAEHVAEAADAWLAEPHDADTYRRLVAAILRRREYLNPTLLDAADPG